MSLQTQEPAEGLDLVALISEVDTDVNIHRGQGLLMTFLATAFNW